MSTKNSYFIIRRIISIIVIFTFCSTGLVSPGFAQNVFISSLPVPGSMVRPSEAFIPVLLKGMVLHPEDAFRFDFIIDSGNADFDHAELHQESEKLVKYFMAALTVPKNDLWVNLSPYEQNRIIPEELGKTVLGRDMLVQDYILKQLTATLMYPENELGKKFWDKIYALTYQKFGTRDIPLNTFNKVWILPESATVFENNQTVYITEGHLKVLMDEDYLALEKNNTSESNEQSPQNKDSAASLSSQIIREIILPEIEREVNEGKNFAPLRQIYHSLILAQWYKDSVKENLLTKIYVDQRKVTGVDSNDQTIKDQIFERYMSAYKKGVFDYIKEDYDQLSQQVIPRKYFSGGEKFRDIRLKKTKTVNPAETASPERSYKLGIRIANQSAMNDLAMTQESSDGDSKKVLEASPDQGVLSVAIPSDKLEKIIEFAGKEVRRFLQFVNNPEADPEYLGNRKPEDIESLVGPEVVSAAKEYLMDSDLYATEKLMAYGEALIPVHSVRIEIDKAKDSSVRQIMLRGIPPQFSDVIMAHAKGVFTNDEIAVTNSGRLTTEFRAREISKVAAIEYLQSRFNSILDQMEYAPGDFIDARQSRSVIVTDADGSIWSTPEVRNSPSLTESEDFEALIEYLRAGGILLITTGNLFSRTLSRLESNGGIPVELRNRILLSTSGGLTLYMYGKDGELKEIDDYQDYLNAKESPSELETLDLIYIGDSESKTGNDYLSFQKVGFNRSFLVTKEPIGNVPEELRSSYVGNNVIGAKRIFEAVVEMVREKAGNKAAPLFTDNADKVIKEKILGKSVSKINANLSVTGIKLRHTVKRAVDTFSISNNIVLVQGVQKEGVKDSEEIAQKLLLNGSIVNGYNIDLNQINFEDPLSVEFIKKTLWNLIPTQGKIVLVLDGIEKMAAHSSFIRDIISHPQIVTVGVTNFAGYRKIEEDRFLAKDLNFLVTEPNKDKSAKEKRVVVIGASGFLGEKVYRMYKDGAADKSNILGTAFTHNDKLDKLDITDEQAIEEYFRKHQVDVVIYAAGEANADNAKNDLPRARSLNAGVVSLIRKHFNGKFVYLSTEYIFDGKDETAPYISTSPGNPVNEYGLTKLEGEELTLQEFADPLIVRLGVLYGYNHPNDKNHFVKDVINKLRHGKDFEVDDKQIKRPIMIDDVALSLMKLIDHDVSGIFQLNGYEPVTKYQEARAVADVYYEIYPEAKRVTITPTYKETSVPRPLNTFMVNSDTSRPFRDGLTAMMFQAASSEDLTPIMDENPSAALQNREPDAGEKIIFEKIQREVREGRITPENIDQYNQVRGEIQPYNDVETLPAPGTSEYQELKKRGESLNDVVGFSMGGLSSRSGGLMRLGYRFNLGNVDTNAHSILEWKLGNVRRYNTDHRRRKPVAIMTSQSTEESFGRIRQIMNDFDLQQSGLYSFDNGLQQRLLWDQNDPQFGEVARQDDGTVIVNPPGHFAFIRQLVVSGLLAKLRRQGVEFIFHSNMNNFGALVDNEYDAIRGLFAKKIEEARVQGVEPPMTLVEVIDNPKNQLGTFPVSLNGHFALVRNKSMPENLDPNDLAHFNTGNYHFYIDAILQRLGFSGDYDTQYSSEDIAKKFDEVFDVKPQISAKDFVQTAGSAQGTVVKTLQIERNLDDFIAKAPVVAVRVSQDRFIPIKTEDSLRKERQRLNKILKGHVDVRYGPYRLTSISDDDKEVATTTFISFRNNIRQQVWGGHWIEHLKGLTSSDEHLASESVEVSSHPDFPSIMILNSGERMDITDVGAFGFADEFFGKRVVEEFGPRIPFMLKFLDAQRALSIQVHPSHPQAKILENIEEERGKEEVFFILNAEEDNEMVLGLKKGVTDEDFRRAVETQDPEIENMVYRVTVKPGEIYRIPYGTIHSFQRGIQAIELSHMSDLTYRVYDYKRREKLPLLAHDRTVHIRESLASINFDLPREDEFDGHYKKEWVTTEILPNEAGKIQTAEITPDFHVDRFIFNGIGENKGRIIEPTAVKGKTEDRFHALMGVKGSVLLKRVADGKTRILKEGETVFIPAGVGEYEIITNNNLQSIVYRFYPQLVEEYPKINIGVSLGGSKFAFGLVDSKGHVYQNTEFNWRERLNGEAITPDKIEELIMGEIDRLLTRFVINPKQVGQIGIAIPGPVNYREGEISTTYLPFKNYPLPNSIQEKFNARYQHTVEVSAVLDVLADVLGELKHEKGSLKGQTQGMVLNLATGIAVGVLKDNEILDSTIYRSDVGEELEIETGLSQVGRHLIRKKINRKTWEYRPTRDGSIPEFDSSYERFSQALAGPPLAKRFIKALIEVFGESYSSYFDSVLPGISLEEIAKRLLDREVNPESVLLEKLVLEQLTLKAYQGDSIAASLVRDIGFETGSAMAAFIRAYPNIIDPSQGEWRLILVGSVGEKLGNPKATEERYKYQDDIYIDAFNNGLKANDVNNVRVLRSQVEVDGPRIREIVAFQSGSDYKTLIKDLDQNPTLETYHRVFKELRRASLDHSWTPISLRTQDVLGNEMEYKIVVPSQMMKNQDHQYVLNYLSALLNIQGELRGLSSYRVFVWGKQDADLQSLLADQMKSDFPGTSERVNFGKPIAHTKLPASSFGKVEQNAKKDVDYNSSDVVIGVDIGGTTIKLVALQNGTIIKKAIIGQDEFVGGTGYAQEFWKKVEAFADGLDVKVFNTPVVIGVPGSVNPQGEIVDMPNLEAAKPGVVASLNLFAQSMKNVTFVNDADLAGEYQMRSRHLTDDVVVVNTLGTGLGAAAFIGQNRVPGLFAAHIRTNFSTNAPQSNAGIKGDLEDTVNEAFIVTRTKELLKEQVLEGVEATSSKDIAAWLEQIDTPFEKIAKQVFYEFGQNIVDFYKEMIRVYGLKGIDRVILTGGISQGRSGEYIVEGIMSAIKAQDLNINKVVVDDFTDGSDYQSAPLQFQGAVGAALVGLAVDGAMITNNGGIDMNVINVKRQGSGVKVQFDPAMINSRFNSDTFVPVIINLVPINNLMPLLGLETINQKNQFKMSSLN